MSPDNFAELKSKAFTVEALRKLADMIETGRAYDVVMDFGRKVTDTETTDGEHGSVMTHPGAAVCEFYVRYRESIPVSV